MGSNYILKYNVDIAMCMDATGSMGSLLNTVKANALSFYADLTSAMEEKGKHIDELRVRVIAFRDYIEDGENAMLATDFYSLPSDAEEFRTLVNSIEPFGGGDEPEDGLEALAYQETRDPRLNNEDIAIHIENDRDERIDISVAYVRINGLTQRVVPNIYSNSYVEPHTECDALIELDPEYILLSGYDQIYSLEISLVVTDDSYNDIHISPFVSIPIEDNRSHQITATPIWISLVENEHIEASVLGYSIDGYLLHLYFNLKTDDTVPDDNRHIRFIVGREKYSSERVMKINGINSVFFMLETYDRQSECAFVVDIFSETPIDAIQTVEFPFVIYGVDGNTSEVLRLISSDAITLYFDSHGNIESADGTVKSYSDSLSRYYS